MCVKTYCKHTRIDETLVREAYQRWLRSRSGKRNGWRVEQEHGSAQALINEIAYEVSERRLRLRAISRHRYVEPTNGKVRTIGVESVKQQVLDYAIVIAIEPMLSAKVGFWQVGGIPGKGQLMAAHALRRWSQDGGYWVHVDVAKCYSSISCDLVRGIVQRYVRSGDVAYALDAVLDTYDGGLEIGSYLSLRLSQLVLSFAYHHVEGLGKARRGTYRSLVSHQVWYADDAILMSRDKRDLRSAVRALERYMRDELGLSMHPWKVCRIGDEEPIDLAGFVVRPRRTTVRPSVFLKARRSVRRFERTPTERRARQVTSYWGWLSNADCDGFVRRSGVVRAIIDASRMISAREGVKHAR